MSVVKALLLALPVSIVLVSPAVAQDSSAAATPVARIALASPRTTVAVNDSVKLEARALDANGRPVPAKIVFQSIGPAQAQIDSGGWVRAGSVGDVPLIATAIVPGTKPYIEHLSVRVVPGPARRIEIARSAARLVPRQRVQLSARVLSAEGDARGDAVTWSSSSPSVARVSRDGLVEARAGGQTTIRASAGGLRAEVPVEVVRETPSTLTLEPATAKVRQGDVVKFTATPHSAGSRAVSGLTPTWSFGPGEGHIDDDGTFVAYEPGTYTVTAALGDRSATAEVTVTRREVRRPATVVGAVVRKAYPTAEVWLHPNGKVAYLGTHLGGDRLYTIDVTDPAKPVVVDSLQANTRVINDIMTDKEGKVLVFTREGAADRRNGIVICTLEDPLHPKVVSEFTQDVTSGVHSAFIYSQPKYGTQVYLTNDGTGALHVVDITDPAHPKELSRWKTPRADYGRSLHDIDVQDGLVYASWWHDGMVILDVGNGVKGGSPSNPQLVSQFKYDLDSLYRQVAETGGPGFIRGTHTAWRHKNYVFVADEVFGVDAGAALFKGQPSRAYGRLHVLDVSDLAHPKEVAWYEPEYGGVHNVWVAGDTLYMGAYNAGFLAFDVSGELRGDLRAQGRIVAQVSTTAPEGFLPNSPMTWGVVVKNNLAYVNDFNNGLFIVRLEPKREDLRPSVP
jgi:plastocyanin